MREPNRLFREASALGIVPAFEIIPTRKDDDRTQVADTSRVPYRWVCFIEMKLRIAGENRGTTIRGTGILVSPRHVLTSAHMFTTRNVTRWTITVAPGRNGKSKPFGEAKVKLRRSSPNYRAGTDNARFDFALLTLDKPIGDAQFGTPPRPLGHWGQTAVSSMTPLAAADIAGKDVEVVGYPDDQPLGTMWKGPGTAQVDAREGRRIEHTADTWESTSGGPVFMWVNQVATLIGIHSMPGVINIDAKNVQTQKNNYATRLTADVLKQIQEWIAKDGP